MNFIKHPQHNLYMGAPRNWDHERDGPCGALSIHDQRNLPMPKMESAWITEGFEGLSLALGIADIRLNIYSPVHPVVSMHTCPKSVPFEVARANLQTVAKQLADYAEGMQLKIVIENGVVQVIEKEPT